MTKRSTVGKLSQDLLQSTPVSTDSIELEREMHKDYEKNVLEAVDRGIKEFPNKNFYVVVETKKERLMKNVIRNMFFPRLSCPTPTWDQTVYKYFRDPERIEFLWVVPAQDICQLVKDNALHLDIEERQLLEFVLAFDDGSLLKLAKKLNGEKTDSDLLEK